MHLNRIITTTKRNLPAQQSGDGRSLSDVRDKGLLLERALAEESGPLEVDPYKDSGLTYGEVEGRHSDFMTLVNGLSKAHRSGVKYGDEFEPLTVEATRTGLQAAIREFDQAAKNHSKVVIKPHDIFAGAVEASFHGLAGGVTGAFLGLMGSAFFPSFDVGTVTKVSAAVGAGIGIAGSIKESWDDNAPDRARRLEKVERNEIDAAKAEELLTTLESWQNAI